MNSRTALLAAVCTLTLAVVAWFLLSDKPGPAKTEPPAGPTWLASLDASPITGLEVAAPDGSAAVLSRHADLGLFLILSRTGTQGPASVVWPVDDTRIRSAARLLADAARAPAGSQSPTSGAVAFVPGVKLTVRNDSVTPPQIHLATVSDSSTWLGGVAQLQTSDQATPLRIGLDLAKVFVPESVMAWRAPDAVPAINLAEPVEIVVETLAGPVNLKKSGTQWNLPDWLITADKDAVAQLTRAAGSIGVKRFLGDSSKAALEHATPTLVLEIRSAIKSVNTGSGEVQRRSLVQKLRVFGAADATGQTLMAIASGGWDEPGAAPMWGPMLLTVGAADVNAVAADPTAFACRTALEMPGADVARIYFCRPATGEDLASLSLTSPTVEAMEKGAAKAVLTRDIDGWTLKGLTAGGKKDATSIEPLIALLTKSAAAKITYLAPAAVKPWINIIPATSKGPFCTMCVGIGADKAGAKVLVVRRGKAFYFYAGDEAAKVIDLISQLVPEEG